MLRPPVNEAAPLTAKEPAIAVLPVASATVNLLLSMLSPPFSCAAPATVAAPVLELQERLGSALDERFGGAGGLRDTCDDLGYRTLGLGFGLLTLGLISGAVWANEAWGAYWSWDPKETWALITWLVYAIYLHTRLSDEYSQGDSNRVAVAGFVVTWVCYLGVNLFGVGLHSYGFLSS